MKKRYIILGIVILVIAVVVVLFFYSNKRITDVLKVDLTNLTYEENNKNEALKVYTQKDFEAFLNDYNNNQLPDVYVTEFLFDGVSMYKTYDLDDFIEGGNDIDVETLKVTTININTTGNIEFSGELTGGMIAVNTNDVKEDINLILNGVKIDTDSKKVPAIYVYNKDVTYADSKVTISLANNSKNYITGGKLKKVSLIGSDELDNYVSKYSNETNYESYTNYYGVYTASEIKNILFAKVEADSEDLADGDPYYYYKASGAISSDIDLYFAGEGYLEVTSNKKEGIETKGNLILGDGVGDYVIYALDDCLNTTTDSKEVSNARNNLTIDVNSLSAIVLNDADEGDAIDSNGELIINGGDILALAHSGQDAGLDSETGTYINGGNVLATGDMYDQVNSDSNQNFIVLSFGSKIEKDTLITLLDENESAVFAYKTDRTYTNLIYSSKDLKEGTYYLYKDGEIDGTFANGLYSKINSYQKGTQLAYSTTGFQGGMRENMRSDNNFNKRPEGMDENMTPPNKNMSNDNSNGTPSSETGSIPQDRGNNDNMIPPEKMDGNDDIENNQQFDNGGMQFNNTSATNKEFKIEGISSLFSGVAEYSE